MKEHSKEDPKIYRICLLGCSLDTGNKGVSALTASLVGILIDLYKNVSFYLLIGNKSSNSQNLVISKKKIALNVVNYRLSFRARRNEHLLYIFILAIIYRVFPSKVLKTKIRESNKWIRTLLQADFIGDIRGGDSFSDIYGLYKFILGSIPRIIVIILGKDLILLPQTYGPYKTAAARCIARYIIKKSSYIMSRDEQSINLIKGLLGNKRRDMKQVNFCPDVAFMLDSNKPDKLNIFPPLVDKKEFSIVGMNINGLMYYGGYTKNNMFGLRLNYPKLLLALINRLLTESYVHMLLIPHTFGIAGNVDNDLDACADILNKLEKPLRSKIHFVSHEYDQNEIKGIIGYSDFFIGSRMHACIAALSQGIPTVGIAYSKKFVGVFKSIGFEEMVVDARGINTENALRKIEDIYTNSHVRKDELAEQVKKVKNDVILSFEKLVCDINKSVK